MKKKFAINLVAAYFLMAQLNFCMGQSEQENLNKYFAYRNWFKMRFIKIGPQPGESLPIENRTIEPNNPVNKKIRWGDATVHLGFYMATLATEYKLYMDENKLEMATKTLNELYYAVTALNRIDDVAEAYHLQLSTYPAVRNGFFLRDDVPGDFLLKFQNGSGQAAGNFPLPNPSSVLPALPYTYEFNNINSDFYFKDGANTTPPLYYSPENETSQDQIIGLLM